MHSRLLNLGTPKSLLSASKSINQQTPKSSKSRSFQGNTSRDRHSPAISLADYIVPAKVQRNKKNRCSDIENTPDSQNRKARRINPTNAAKNLSMSFQSAGNSFNFNETREVSPEHTSERNFLAEERLKILTRSPSVEAQTQKKIKLVMQKQIIHPSEELVTARDELDIAITLYLHVFQNNLILNRTGEVYFLVSLLISNKTALREDVSNASADEGILSIFESIHNNVYFSAQVLSRIINDLCFLDCTTLQLIVENDRFKNFVRDVPRVSMVPRQKSESLVMLFGDAGRLNVCFNSDTDNRENFPSEASFHAFRKQRDLFYEILMTWEQNHMGAAWHFGMLVSKIRSLMTIRTDASNYRHLAKLFKAQLLGSSKNVFKVCTYVF